MTKFIYGSLLVFLIAFYSIVHGNMDKTIIEILLVIVVMSVVLFSSKKEHNKFLKGQYLKHSTLALIGILIVCFQYPLDFILGNVSASDQFIWANRGIVLKSISLSVIGLLGFFLGYRTYKRKEFRVGRNNERPAGVGVLSLLSAASLITYFLTINPLYLAGYYGLVDMGTRAVYAILFFEIFIFASVIQKCRNMLLLNNIPSSFIKYIKLLGWPLVVMILIYLLSVIISGDRGPLITYGLLIFGCYFFVTKKKLPIKYVALFVLGGISFIFILGLARSMSKDLSLMDKLQGAIYKQDSKASSSFFPPTEELARSIRAINWAVSYVPSDHDFFYGRFQFQQFAQAVPFVSTLYPLIFDDNSSKYQGSASYVTWIRQGDYATYGDGTTCITDFYLDFGLTGVVFGMFLFGYLMRLSEVAMYSNEIPSLFKQVFFIVYLSSAIYIARGTLFADLKIVIWVYFAIVLNKYLFRQGHPVKILH